MSGDQNTPSLCDRDPAELCDQISPALTQAEQLALALFLVDQADGNVGAVVDALARGTDAGLLRYAEALFARGE